MQAWQFGTCDNPLKVSYVGETWRARYPVTSFVRQAMLNKSMTAGLSALTYEERVLFVASTFWSATARGELHAWFGSDIQRRARDAIRALTEIGAIRLAGIVRSNVDVLARLTIEDNLDSIEDLLLRSEDQIEELTARYAARAARSEDLDP